MKLEAAQSELAHSKVTAATLNEQLDSSNTHGAAEVRDAEVAMRALKYNLHVEGRESMAAAKLCRGAVKDLALLHAALDASLDAVEAPPAHGFSASAEAAPGEEAPAAALEVSSDS